MWNWLNSRIEMDPEIREDCEGKDINRVNPVWYKGKVTSSIPDNERMRFSVKKLICLLERHLYVMPRTFHLTLVTKCMRGKWSSICRKWFIGELLLWSLYWYLFFCIFFRKFNNIGCHIRSDERLQELLYCLDCWWCVHYKSGTEIC